MNRIIARMKLSRDDNRQKEIDKIQKDELKNYQNEDNNQDDNDMDYPVCDVCKQKQDPKDMYDDDMYFDQEKGDYVTRNICKNCLMEEEKKYKSEQEKRGQEEAEKIQQKYNLPNSYNADSIDEPHLRDYVQALLSYYNSWGDYDDGFTKHCEKSLERAVEEYEEYMDKQKGKKANRIINRIKK